MKKIFTLILMSVMTVAAHAAINIYVQCENAPYIWWWSEVPAGSIAAPEADGAWPGCGSGGHCRPLSPLQGASA